MDDAIRKFTFVFNWKKIVERWALKKIPFCKLSWSFQLIPDSHPAQRPQLKMTSAGFAL